MNNILPVSLDRLVEAPYNPRRRFSDSGMEEMTASVLRHGVLVPLLVRAIMVTDDTGLPPVGYYEIIAGARRFRAAKAAGLPSVPVRVLELTDDEALELAILENLTREDVHPMDEAAGFQALLQRPGYDVAAVAARVSKSESYVYQRLQLLKLIPIAQESFLADRIHAGHALLISRLQPKDQEEALERTYDRYGHERVLVGVRQLAAWIQSNIYLDLSAAPFDTAHEELLPAAGSCVACPKRSGYAPALFADIHKADTCTDPTCYQEKIKAHIKVTQRNARAGGEDLLEVSTEWSRPYSQKAKKTDPIYMSAFKVIHKKAERCSFTKKALVVDGTHDIGRILQVCADPACKKHHGNASTRQQRDPEDLAKEKKEQARRELEIKIRTGVMDAILATIRTDYCSREEWAFILSSVVDLMSNDAARILCRRHDLKPGEDNDYPRWRTIAANWVKGIPTIVELRSLAVEIALLPLTMVGYHDRYDDRPDPLLKAADMFSVDVQHVEDTIKIGAAVQAKHAKAKTTKKRKAK